MRNPARLLTVPEAEELTGLSLRHVIFNNTDGFADQCVVRVGRAVRVRVDRLEEFIESRTGAATYQYHWTAKPGPKPKVAAGAAP